MGLVELPEVIDLGLVLGGASVALGMVRLMTVRRRDTAVVKLRVPRGVTATIEVSGESPSQEPAPGVSGQRRRGRDVSARGS